MLLISVFSLLIAHYTQDTILNVSCICQNTFATLNAIYMQYYSLILCVYIGEHTYQETNITNIFIMPNKSHLKLIPYIMLINKTQILEKIP